MCPSLLKLRFLGRITRAECNMSGKEKKVYNRDRKKQEQNKQLPQLNDFGALLC